MKKSIKLNLVLLSLLIVIFNLNSCRKPVKPQKEKDTNCKCCKTMTIKMTDNYGNAIQAQNNGTVYINNWKNYTKELKANHEYEVTYDEVVCDYGCCGDKNGIAPGGCFPQGNHICINLCTTKEKNCNNNNDCNGTTDDQTISSFINCGTNNAKISNDKLNVNCGYSGCDNNEFKNLVLAYNKEVYFKGMGPQDIIPVKVVNTTDLPMCQAYFTKDVCFDLKNIKNMIVTNNVKPAPEKVYLSIEYVSGKTELIEWPIKY